MAGTAPRLFLSYESGDRPRVEALAEDLRRADCDPFFDAQLSPGTEWWSQLLGEIERCDAFLPVLSRSYLGSEPCRREAEYACNLLKPVLPIRIEAVEAALLAPYIAEPQWVTYDPSDRNALFHLFRGLRDLRECPPLPVPLPPRPEIPISYLNPLQDRLASQVDIPRAEQVVLLSDLKDRLDGSERSTVIFLLQTFAKRHDLVVQVAKEIDALLAGMGRSFRVLRSGRPSVGPTGTVRLHELLAPGVAARLRQWLVAPDAALTIGAPVAEVELQAGLQPSLVRLFSQQAGVVLELHGEAGDAAGDTGLVVDQLYGWVVRPARPPGATGLLLRTEPWPRGPQAAAPITLELAGTVHALWWADSFYFAAPPGRHPLLVRVTPGGRGVPQSLLKETKVQSAKLATVLLAAPSSGRGKARLLA